MCVYPCTGLSMNCVSPFSGLQEHTQVEGPTLEPCRSSEPSMLIKITSGGVWGFLFFFLFLLVLFFDFIFTKQPNLVKLFSAPKREMAK